MDRKQNLRCRRRYGRRFGWNRKWGTAATCRFLLSLFASTLMFPSPVDSTWMYLGLQAAMSSSQAPISSLPGPHLQSLLTSSAASSRDVCARLPGLVLQQLDVCRRNPLAMPCVGLGARLGLIECQYQFQYERWNCSPNAADAAAGDAGMRQAATNITSPVDTLIERGTKETAFVYAATSAGVAHAVTEACSAGNLTECSCDSSRRHSDNGAEDGWRWGGCSDNVQYGLWFSESFVDAPDRDLQQRHRHTGRPGTRDVRALMNLHNNEVGRKVLSSSMKMKCRCHGVSGSCGVKTCWRSVPSFREVGDQLKAKYENSVEISSRPAASRAFQTGRRTTEVLPGARRPTLRRREKRKRREPISETELVHIDRSPNYCRPDPHRGVAGTRGRRCQRGSYGPESCESLCCGRGYHVQEVRRVERCHCRFVWCCEVRCKSCESIEQHYTCK